MRPRSHPRRRAALLLLTCSLGLGSVTAIRPQGEPAMSEERNTIEIFRRGSLGVVHVRADLAPRLPMEGNAGPTGTGSGFVLDTAGRILTGFHVIRDRNVIEVTPSNGHRAGAGLRGSAPQMDIALLRVDAAAEELTALPLGDCHARRLAACPGHPSAPGSPAVWTAPSLRRFRWRYKEHLPSSHFPIEPHQAPAAQDGVPMVGVGREGFATQPRYPRAGNQIPALPGIGVIVDHADRPGPARLLTVPPRKQVGRRGVSWINVGLRNALHLHRLSPNFPDQTAEQLGRMRGVAEREFPAGLIGEDSRRVGPVRGGAVQPGRVRHA